MLSAVILYSGVLEASSSLEVCAFTVQRAVSSARKSVAARASKPASVRSLSSCRAFRTGQSTLHTLSDFETGSYGSQLPARFQSHSATVVDHMQAQVRQGDEACIVRHLYSSVAVGCRLAPTAYSPLALSGRPLRARCRLISCARYRCCPAVTRIKSAAKPFFKLVVDSYVAQAAQTSGFAVPAACRRSACSALDGLTSSRKPYSPDSSTSHPA